MKKSAILATAITAIMAGTAVADTTVYGRLNLSWGLFESAGGAESNGLTNEASRFGFKGSEDLGNGISTVYQIEYGVGADTQGSAAGLRVGMVGLKGDFGTVAMGTMWTPSYSLVRGNADPFNSIGGNVYAGNFPAATRATDVVAYINKFGDISFQAAILSSETTDEVKDGHDIAISLPVGPVTLGVAIGDISDPYAAGNERSPTAFSVKYAEGDLTAAVVVLDGDNDATATSIMAAYNLSSANTVTVQLEDDDADSTGTNFGFAHKMSKRTTAFVEVQTGDFGDDTRVSLKHNF